MNAIKVYVADDHAVVREGIKALARAEGDLEIVGEAADGTRALEDILARGPDVAVLDISMPGLTGIQVAAQLKEQGAQTRVLALSIHEDRAYLRQFLAAGGLGYVLKRSLGGDLIAAIRKVAAGESFIDPELASSLAMRGNGSSMQHALGRTQLSEREDEVLRLIAQGYSHKEIAARLELSAKTVETYKMRSFEKLGLKTRADVVRYAIQQGWLATA
jgi:DNA-binding NarL/FixJ family response regulator